jgi:hypothetical protein
LDLYDSTGTHIGTTTTDEDGHYQFDDSNTTGLLPDTDYQIRIEDPSNFEDGGPLDGFEPTEVGQGDAGTDSNIDDSGDGWVIDVRTPAEGGSDMTFDGGVYKPGVGDLAIEKTVTSTPQEVVDSNNINWNVLVSNVGTATIPGPIAAVDTIPEGQSFTSAEGEGWTCTNAGQLVTCIRTEELVAGAEAPPITVVTRAVTEQTLYTNAAEVTAPGDTNVANNTDDAEIDLSAAVVENEDLTNPDPTTTTTPGSSSGTVPNELASTNPSNPSARTGASIALALFIALGLVTLGGAVILMGKRRRGAQR